MSDLVDGYPRMLVAVQDDLAPEFEARLRDSGTLAFRVAYGVLRHREDAEDVAQDAFARAFRNFGQLRDRERFRAWLVRTAWRLAIDRRRGDRRRLAREDAAVDTPTAATTEEVASARQRASHLWNAIDELPDKLRVVIVLSGIEGHDTREVGALLGIPDGTVRSRLFTARKILAERLRWLTTTT